MATVNGLYPKGEPTPEGAAAIRNALTYRWDVLAYNGEDEMNSIVLHLNDLEDALRTFVPPPKPPAVDPLEALRVRVAAEATHLVRIPKGDKVLVSAEGVSKAGVYTTCRFKFGTFPGPGRDRDVLYACTQEWQDAMKWFRTPAGKVWAPLAIVERDGKGIKVVGRLWY